MCNILHRSRIDISLPFPEALDSSRTTVTAVITFAVPKLIKQDNQLMIFPAPMIADSVVDICFFVGSKSTNSSLNCVSNERLDTIAERIDSAFVVSFQVADSSSDNTLLFARNFSYRFLNSEPTDHSFSFAASILTRIVFDVW